MKIFGYCNDDDEHIVELKEISFLGNSEELKRVAEFIAYSASQISIHKEKYDHEHYRDYDKHWNKSEPDIIVVSQK